MNPLLNAALVWGGCAFWLSVLGFSVWALSIVIQDRRTNNRRARLSNRSLERIAGQR